MNENRRRVSVDDKVLDEVRHVGDSFFVGETRVVPEVTHPPMGCTITPECGIGMDYDEAEIHTNAVRCLAKDEDLSRTNGYIQWEFKKIDIRDALLEKKDYVLVGISYKVGIQFCKWRPARNSKNL